jgi:hypothetical protein
VELLDEQRTKEGAMTEGQEKAAREATERANAEGLA